MGEGKEGGGLGEERRWEAGRWRGEREDGSMVEGIKGKREKRRENGGVGQAKSDQGEK